MVREGRALVTLLLFLLVAQCALAARKPQARPSTPRPATTERVLLAPIVRGKHDLAFVQQILAREDTDGICLIVPNRSLITPDGSFDFEVIEERLLLCEAAGKHMDLLVYMGKWSDYRPAYTFIDSQSIACQTPMPWHEDVRAALRSFWLALGRRFDGRPGLRSVYVSGHSPLNGAEMCVVPDDTAQARSALLEGGYTAARYRATIKWMIQVVNKAFPSTNIAFALHFMVQQDPDATMYRAINSWGHELCGERWSPTVWFFQADTDDAVLKGNTGGVASVTRECLRLDTSYRFVQSCNPRDVPGILEAALNLGVYHVQLPVERLPW